MKAVQKKDDDLEGPDEYFLNDNYRLSNNHQFSIYVNCLGLYYQRIRS